MKKIIIRTDRVGIQDDSDYYGSGDNFEFWLNQQLEYHNINVEKHFDFIENLISKNIWKTDEEEHWDEFLDKILNNAEIKKTN